MAYSATNFTASRSLSSILVAPFLAVGRGLVAMAEAGPRMEQIRKLNAISDEDLAAQGLNRADVVRKIFGNSFYL